MSLEPIPAEESFRLREYLGVLRVRKLSVIVITLLAILAALFYIQRQAPTYTSTARVLATNPIAAFAAANSLAAPNMVNEVALVSSTRVQKCAAQIYNQSTGQPVVLPSPTPSSGAAPAPSPTGSASPSPRPSGSVTPAPAPSSTAPPPPPTIGELCSDAALAGVSTVGAGLRQGLAVTTAPGTTFLSVAYSSHSRAKAQAAAEAFAQAYVQIKSADGLTYLNGLRAGQLTRQVTLTHDSVTQLNNFTAATKAGDTQGAN